MPNVIFFQDVITRLASVKSRYLLLGNGFSISLKPDIFAYGSLFDNADFSAAPRVEQIFDSLDTKDFEVVIHHLEDAARVVEIYRPALKRLAEALRDDAAVVKDALVSVVAKRHPDRPYNIDDAAYMACRTFLSNFTNIFSLNYDVLLYWTMMHKDVDSRNLNYDDGFRHPEEDYGAPFVSWQEGQKATVHYLHGALHLFDSKSDIIKYTWSKTDIAIVDQIRSAMANDKYPIFVAEGTSASKRTKILHSAYLHKCLRSFESCCDVTSSAIVIFGHSLADNDRHILKCIEQGKVSQIFVSIYGDIDSPANKKIVEAANLMSDARTLKSTKYPLNVSFFDSVSAHVWG